LLSCAACAQQQKPAKVYPLKGVIVKVDIPGKSAAIDAAKIEGFMEAMTMDYPVHDAKELAGLKPGDHITAVVHVPEDLSYWIDNVRKQ
jgi:Cu/Ag efflux protein CusF